MTKQEALLHFERLKDNALNQVMSFERLFHQRSNHRRDEELFGIAIAAIKKQLPKKPYYRKEAGTEGYACSVCDMGVTVDHGRIRDAYCSHCGQAIDWEA